MKRSYRLWTREERALVRLHYGPFSRELWNNARIAAALGRTPEQVRQQARSMGLVFYGRKRRRITERQLLAVYDAGLSDRQAGRKLGVGKSYVFRWRRRTGRPPKGTPGRPAERTLGTSREGE